MNSRRWASSSRIPRKVPPGRSRDERSRDAFPKALALLHLHQMGGDRCRDPARPETPDRAALETMGQSLPNYPLRPFLAADTPLLAAIFVSAIEELTGDDYSEAQQEAWAAAAEDEDQFGKRLASELTLIATLQNAPVGFASLKGADHIDMLYVHPSVAGQGGGAMLCGSLENLAGAAGANSLTADASDNTNQVFRKRGYVGHPPNTAAINGRWLRLHNQA